ncbi:MAG TPA: hypothetical protein VMW78_10490 [Anaerolineae bacterium]|nr:hypothetical protein [Anaerolineae bacterium]
MHKLLTDQSCLTIEDSLYFPQLVGAKRRSRPSGTAGSFKQALHLVEKVCNVKNTGFCRSKRK